MSIPSQMPRNPRVKELEDIKNGYAAEVMRLTAERDRLQGNIEQLQRLNKALDNFLVERTAERDRLREVKYAAELVANLHPKGDAFKAALVALRQALEGSGE